MNSSGKWVTLLAAAALLAAASFGSSQAATITVTPGAQTIAPGGVANVDIVLSGLAPSETVGGFSFQLSFNNSILGAPDSFTANPANLMGPLPLDLSNGFTGGRRSPLDVFVIADPTIADATLKAAQGTGFTLATVSLTGLNEGVSPLTLSTLGAFLSAFTGGATIPATVVNGSVCVDNPNTPGNPCLVSEPPTMAMGLLGLSLVLLFGLRRRNPALEA